MDIATTRPAFIQTKSHVRGQEIDHLIIFFFVLRLNYRTVISDHSTITLQANLPQGLVKGLFVNIYSALPSNLNCCRIFPGH